MADDPARGHLVVVGSSAGGIEALSILVGTLPRDFGAPIVLAQHLDPRRPSHLGEILTRRTALPVVTVEQQAKLAGGTIHVIPANRHVEVTDHDVRLSEPADGKPAPSIDHVLTTAAETFGEGLIAVILTGTGSDGAEGARRVKAAGGTVIIQDPETARFPAMPSSLAPTSVDVIAGIEAIGPLLHDLITGVYRPTQPDDERLLAAFLNDLRERSGIDFAAYKRPTILRRLQRRMAATRNSRLRDYVRYLGKHPEEYQRLASSFLIKVTEFFRDAELFDQLRDAILPGIIAEARERGRELRLWSAGCATGEEAYSLAILVADLLGDEAEDWTVRIFATDLDTDAITFARRGLYPGSALQHLPADLVRRHFSGKEGEYEVRKHVRAMTVFGQHDLAMRAPFPRVDLALCRNVLIYFTPELQKRALQLFAFSLRDGGWLVLGKAETTSPLADDFVLEDANLKLFRRRGERLVVPRVRLGEAPLMPLRLVGGRGRHGWSPHLTESIRARPSAEWAEATIAALPIGVVLVNQAYDIVTLNAGARRMLGIHGSAIGQDMVHLADRLPSPRIREAIDNAIAGRGSTITIEVAGRPTQGRQAVWLEIDCLPGLLDAEGGRDGALVLVRDVTEMINRVGQLEQATAGEHDQAERLGREMSSYREENRRLQAANDELTSANADLRGANEEMVVASEEVQAATEEVETLNEELQATNEELETLNEELQATVAELNTTNDDMHARTAELQDMTATLDEQRRGAETERARLATLLERLQDAVLVVDRSGRPVIRNGAYDELMRLETLSPRESQGAPVTLEALRSRVASGEEFALPFSAMTADGRRHWYEATGRPVPAEMGIGKGGILVVHDTTDVSLRRLQEEFVAVVAHELRTPLTALRGYLQMLQRGSAGAPEQPVLPLAVEQADRLQGLVDELFDAARADRGRIAIRPEPIRLRELVHETVEIASGLSSAHQFRVEARGTGELVVTADRGRLQQVLLNLFMNAIVHAPDAHDIEVRIRRLRQRAEIEVEDHGPGIARDLQGRLFDRYAQAGSPRKSQGLGLGLFISREIVTAHGGTIDLDSAPGEGTTFTVRLPLAGADGDTDGTKGGKSGGRKRSRQPSASGDGNKPA